VSYEDALEQQVELWTAWRDYPDHIGRATSRLQFAETYWLGSEVHDLVRSASRTLPRTVRLASDLLPSPSGFVLFDRPIPIAVNHNDPGLLCALQWTNTLLSTHPGASLQRGISGLGYVRPDTFTKPIPGYFSSWLYGETLDAAVKRDIGGGGWTGTRGGGVTHNLTQNDKAVVALQVELLASLWLFIQQTILVATATGLARHARKRIERAGWESSPLVRVVQLRRRETQQPVGSVEQQHEWTCQWLVRGHWRQQFYPSKKVNQPLWITPYVKGPDDKPLKPPRATVFAVVR
jgi:hypothetical protein